MPEQIKCLVPDLPTFQELTPFLKELDLNRWYTNFGPLVSRFEAALIEVFFSEKPCSLVTTSSGTSALELAIQALNIPFGRKVLVPSYTFPATITAILKNRLEPIFCDVNKDDWLLNVSDVESKIKDLEIGLVLPVATFGNPVDAALWDNFSETHHIPVVIDAAAALGSQDIPKRAVVTFSLHATKAFAAGEGGLVISYDQSYIDRVRVLSNFGFDKGQIQQLGTNAKLSEYHAAVGLAQLARWDELKEKREKLYLIYKENFTNAGVKFQKVNSSYIPSVLPVLFPKDICIDSIMQEFTINNVETRRWYAPAAHQHQGIVSMCPGVQVMSYLPVTESLVGRVLGLPFHTYLSESTIKDIRNVVENYFESKQ